MAKKSLQARREGEALAVLWLLAGSRLEALKVAPVARALGTQARCLWAGLPEEMPEEVRDLRWQSLTLTPDWRRLRRAARVRALRLRVGAWLLKCQPRAVLVQGDSDCAYAAAQACHALAVPLAHLDAGLRSGHLRSPFPEEAYRRTIGRIAGLHLAPTARAALQLIEEGVPRTRILRIGSTAIDGLRALLPLERATRGSGPEVLVDLHREEHAGDALNGLAQALVTLAARGCRIGLLAQAGSQWQRRWSAALGPRHGVDRLPPLSRPQWWQLAHGARLVVSDSGTAAEELPYLGVPLLLWRRHNDRHEALETRHARLLPSAAEPSPQTLLPAIEAALAERHWPAAWPLDADSPYGDGRAGKRAARALGDWLATLAADRPQVRRASG